MVDSLEGVGRVSRLDTSVWASASTGLDNKNARPTAVMWWQIVRSRARVALPAPTFAPRRRRVMMNSSADVVGEHASVGPDAVPECVGNVFRQRRRAYWPMVSAIRRYRCAAAGRSHIL